MAFEIEPTALPDVLLITTDVFMDGRGRFMETYHRQRYSQHGLDRIFVQDNCSHSRGRTLRGLQYQLNHPQGKLIWVARGEIYDVAVDVRTGSPTYGQWTGHTLSDANHNQLYVPQGFAHGFCVLSQEADVHYKCTAYYVPQDERGIVWNDHGLGIDWPIDDPLLSEKDSNLPQLDELSPDDLPVYRSG